MNLVCQKIEAKFTEEEKKIVDKAYELLYGYYMESIKKQNYGHFSNEVEIFFDNVDKVTDLLEEVKNFMEDNLE